MRKITIILFITLCNISFSQNPVIPLESWDGTEISNAYYKDSNNLMDQFEGVWLYSNGTDTLTIVLKKLDMYSNGVYYTDLMLGEYKYVKNGIVLIDNLSKIDIDYDNQYKHAISGKLIIKNTNKPYCTNCTTNQKRLYLGFSEVATKNTGSMVIKKLSGLQNSNKIEIKLYYNSRVYTEAEASQYTDPYIPYGDYVLTKQ